MYDYRIVVDNWNRKNYASVYLNLKLYFALVSLYIVHLYTLLFYSIFRNSGRNLQPNCTEANNTGKWLAVFH